MKEEAEDKIPTSLKDYLAGTKEMINVFRWFYRECFTVKSKKFAIKLFVALLSMMLVQAIQPGALSYVFDGLAKKQSQAVMWGLGIYFACLIFQKIAQRFHDHYREWIIGLNWVRLDDRVTELFFEKSLAQHVHEGSALATSTIEKGKTKINETQGIVLFNGIPVVIQFMISWIFLWFLNWTAGLIMTAVILIYLSWSMYLNYRVAVVCTPIDRRWRRLNRRRIERWDNVERVKVVGKEIIEMEEMSSVFENILIDDRAFWLRYIDITVIRSFLNSLGLVAVMSWGAWLVWSGKMNLGLLYPLYSWASRVSENIWQLGDTERHLNWNMPAIQSMIKAISIPPAIIDAPDAIVLDHTQPHHIRFVEVSHSYLDKSKISEEEKEAMSAISRVSFDIYPGEKVALIGPSGSGKSTLMKLFLWFDNPTTGSILIDGVDLRKITQASWKRGIGYIPQQAQVLDGTIRYNLTYGLTEEEKKSITDEQLWELMRLLQVDFGKRLINGLDTVVGKRGMKLSGGQAQRLMIAAALIKMPWFLVADEPTSSLDSTNEKKVHAGVEVVISKIEMSALFVAHRLSTVRKICSKFVVFKDSADLKNGDSQIEAIGSSFEELYQISPTFRRLADDQGIKI